MTLFDLILYVPVNNLLSYVGPGLPRLHPYYAGINVSFSKTQSTDAGEE